MACFKLIKTLPQSSDHSGSIALRTAYGPIPDYIGAMSSEPVITTLESVPPAVEVEVATSSR